MRKPLGRNARPRGLLRIGRRKKGCERSHAAASALGENPPKTIASPLSQPHPRIRRSETMPLTFRKKAGSDNPADDAASRLEFQLNRVDKQIDREAELIHNRLQWLLATQGFLLAGYFLKLPAGSPLEKPLPRILLFMGAISSITISISVFIAFIAAWQMRPVRRQIEEELNAMGYSYLAVRRPNGVFNILGAIPPLVISLLIFVTWVLIAITT